MGVVCLYRGTRGREREPLRARMQMLGKKVGKWMRVRIREDMGIGNGGYIRMLMLMRLITRPIDDYGCDSQALCLPVLLEFL